ncbi:Aste57867_12345 [Aphanomyces stellatus]|uniref:Aste57867_12345 protein n=1 Tax=Aphanomyces stellatus TaxID=120398 RepID=A0A485KV99_9STRA|nr:hypothetical protein As57867_012299 [Aphanomyces stellatus]VFT89197.1 Aste57867_12345 [Aphanomyces stellatus]
MSNPSGMSAAAAKYAVDCCPPPLALPINFRRGIIVFAVVKHSVCALYFAAQAFIFFTLNPIVLNDIQAYAPFVVATSYSILAILHAILLAKFRFQLNSKRPTVASISSSNAVPSVKDPTSSLGCLTEPLWHLWSRVQKALPRDTLVLVFNGIQLASQSYQVTLIASTVVDVWLVVVYSVVVLLHCCVAPLIFYSRHSQLKGVFVKFTNSVISFCLTVVFPLAGVVVPSLAYLLVDPNLPYDPTWSTRVMLVSRVVVVASPSDYVTKLVMDAGTLFSLRKLGSVLAKSVPYTKLRHHQNIALGGISAANSIELIKPIVHGFRRVRRPQRQHACYLVWSVLWGIVLVILLVRAWFFRTNCPVTCVAQSIPIFDLTCRCKYVHVNCHAIGNESLDVASVLDPAQLGHDVFFLQVSRCALPDGIPSASLAAQPQLEKIHIQFTNMTSWSGTLPPSVNHLVVRYSGLATVPDVLQHGFPPRLTSLYFEACPLKSLPAGIETEWQSLYQLMLVNTSLTHIPSVVGALHQLTDLNLGFNRMGGTGSNDSQSSVSFSMLTNLTNLIELDLSATDLTDGPWTLTATHFTLDLRLNPIFAVPSAVESTLLTNRRILLDGTTFCNASTHPSYCHTPSTCAPNCLTTMVGNHLCDLACFNAECNYDNADCDAYGFTRP